MRFEDKIVLITGASSGIGRECAYLFAKEGARVILVARSMDRLKIIQDELEKRYKQEFYRIKCDVSNNEEVIRMSNEVLNKFNYLDILVNNAGFAIFNKVIDSSIHDIESQIKTNLLGAIYCIKAFLPSMLERDKGRIINVASLAASISIPYLASYCASKFGLLGFSQALAHELHNTNVKVTLVSPITVRTNFFSNDSFKNTNINLRLALDAKTVARAILRAASSKRVEITVPFYARGAIWLIQTFPYILNPIIRSIFTKR